MKSLNFFVFSLNIWGLPGWIAKNKEKRITAIGSALATSNYDVICLQEVWIQSDYKSLKEAVSKMYPFAHYFYSGVIGSGLCVFSKWPIRYAMFHQWPLNGYIHMIHHGDWFGGKGVGLVVLDVLGYSVNVYTTHLHAQYDLLDPYLVHRVEQAFDTGLFIKLTSETSDLTILAGDLNTEPNSLCERLVRLVGGLHDSYKVSQGDFRIGTNECNRNSYSPYGLVKQSPSGIRIDYILYKIGKSMSGDVVDYKLPLPERVPSSDFSFSDHEAVSANFSAVIGDQANKTIEKEESDNSHEKLMQSFKDALEIFDTSLVSVNRTSTFYWSLALALLFGIVVTPLFLEFPLLHSSWYYLTLILSVVFMVVFILMATLWCSLEYNGILGAKERMLLYLSAISNESSSG